MPEHTAGGGSDPARVREIAEAAAEKAVEKVFRQLRIRLDDESSVDEFIDNQRFVRQLRASRGALVAEVRSTGLDVLKQAVRYVLVACILGLGAGLGVHFGSQLPAITPPVLGGRP